MKPVETQEIGSTKGHKMLTLNPGLVLVSSFRNRGSAGGTDPPRFSERGNERTRRSKNADRLCWSSGGGR